jgi:hypothetical protein
MCFWQQRHFTQTVAPSSTVYKGYRVHETPPPTHGLAALLAMNIMEDLCPWGEQEEGRGSVQQAHLGKLYTTLNSTITFTINITITINRPII